MGFLRRSGEQLLDIFLAFESTDDPEPFLSAALRNLYRVRRLEITTYAQNFESTLTRRFKRSALAMEHLVISNDINITSDDITLNSTIFEGQFQGSSVSRYTILTWIFVPSTSPPSHGLLSQRQRKPLFGI